MEDDDHISEDEYRDDDEEPEEEPDFPTEEPNSSSNLVLTVEEIQQRQSELKRAVSEVLGVVPDIAQAMLIFFRWDKDALFQSYWDNPETTARKCGVSLVAAPEITEPKFDCAICFSEVPTAEGISLACGHIHCRECVVDHLESSISKGPSCITTMCPHEGCPFVFTEAMFSQLCSPQKFTFYTKYLVHNFVEGSAELKWCPAPSCVFAVQHQGSGACRCRCGHVFCFHCGEEVHNPATCDMVERWKVKCNDESEDLTWITANTKQCPKCQWPIQKNQGCNHMTCSLCHHEFCWMCRGPWTEHGSETGGFYKCNKYDPKKHDDPYAEAAKNKLTYYVHYFERYNAHLQSQKFAANQRKVAEDKVMELQGTAGYDRQRADFLLQAVEQLFECRRVLKWTYTFGYYLNEGPEKNLFEFLQQNLEKNTEHLSELTERPIENIERMALINYTQATKKFLQNLLEGIENGLRN